ncbi:MAG TPA: cysteine--tRNA ligase [Candidatus Absconditabacterales bacterium]|nr:cysteine--tRNA ligase [Candidatus Absconditabacterales bacterium]
MKLKIYNTMSRQKEEFVPLMEDPNYNGPKKDFVGMYSCGPTVYRDPSIGNYRATFTADLIRNTLKLFGYKVISVMNITDVGHLTSDADDGEDKLEKGAKREGISVWEVAKKYENIFMKGMKALNIDTFDVMPKATDHIAEQISLIQKLEEKAYTYEVPGDGIYMDTSKVENYGELMGPNYKKRLEDLNAGIRVDMGGKKNPTDFALWKFSPQNEKRQMEWSSPRGIGFPGWHIECSAMSSKYLGEQFDIHHGGADHITIHHPNEIAQSECGFGVHPWVKYWVHNEFLQVDGGKMSKSLGNVYTLEDVQKRGYSPLDLKYFYFMAQYSNFQNFTWEQLDVAKNTRQALIKKLQGKEELKDRKEFENDPFFKEAMEAISDNINTPKLLAIIQSSLNNVNENTYAIITFFENNFLKLGLFEEQEKVEIPSEIQELAQKRREAKKNKDWGTADSLRDQLTSLGWKILDRPDGFEVEKI